MSPTPAGPDVVDCPGCHRKIPTTRRAPRRLWVHSARPGRRCPRAGHLVSEVDPASAWPGVSTTAVGQATEPARPADVVGGLEIRRSPAGSTWRIHLPDGTDLWELSQPRHRNAVAVRGLLLAALPDWTGVTAAEWPKAVDLRRRAAIGRAARRWAR